MIALLSALHEEIKDIKKEVVIERTVPLQGWWFAIGRFYAQDVLLVQTGVGRERAEMATEYILQNYPISILIILGFGGALTQELKVGDLILCRKIQCEGQSMTNRAYHSDRNLIHLAAQVLEGAALDHDTGNCLTVNRVMTCPAEKEDLGKVYQCQVVDMENYWIARLALERRIPFLAVRAISDASSEKLPPFDRFIDTHGALRWTEMMRYFIVSPKELMVIPRIYLQAKEARGNLTYFARAFMSKVGSRRA